MIKTTTYLESENQIKSLLASFTPLDRSISDSLNKEVIYEHYGNLLLRLSTLCYYHGWDVPQQLLTAIEKDENDNLFNLINSYLELGIYEENSEIVNRRELQQEIVHFSRIVDIQPSKQELDSALEIQNKRLKKSKFLPDTLKVLTEILTVVRSRHLSRGKKVQLPVNTYRELNNIKNDGSITVQYANDNTDYILIIQSDRQRLRREVSYLYKFLLEYLTPVESALALSIYLTEIKPKNKVSLFLITAASDDKINTLTWQYVRDSNNDFELVDWVKGNLPKIKTIESVELQEELTKYFKKTSPNLSINVIPEHNQYHISFNENNIEPLNLDITLVQQQNQSLAIEDICKKAISLIEKNLDGNILSIECGHIHLDRELDRDQDTGMTIGSTVFQYLKRSQEQPPLLTPMVDDDHVIIQLLPKIYDTYFSNYIGRNPYELIPESSPIIRAILVSLYAEMAQSNFKNQIVLGGDNLYLEIDEYTTCELFEDFNGWCDNGCAFFELGLLIYRSAPRYFAEYVHKRFNLEYNLHDKIFSILNKEIPHNDKVENIKTLYAKFDEITNPHQPDQDFKNHVFSLLKAQNGKFNHLNILEDYYEVQQHKVRAMIELLNLPINLKSLHFNTATGRVVLTQ
ncbi:hypothetical protein CN272_27930 [Bacillus anthracis]|nr:hypothetical protein CN272_27930 [Bacillus anthracis]PFD87209.1 hypothetical protein CN275_20280 [Bacillus anthracis]PFT20062.1 hypothetical protein COK52_22770 [Bacillus thuringiensis]